MYLAWLLKRLGVVRRPPKKLYLTLRTAEARPSTGVGDSTAEGLQQPLSKPQDIALRLEDRLKAAAAEELDILQRALDDLPGWSLPC